VCLWFATVVAARSSREPMGWILESGQCILSHHSHGSALLAKNKTATITQPPCSPDLTPCNVKLLPRLKKGLGHIWGKFNGRRGLTDVLPAMVRPLEQVCMCRRAPLRCILFTKNDRLCGLVVGVPGYTSRGHGSISRRYQVFWEVVGLERGPLSVVRITEGATWMEK
jgi:hypothetical protein